MKNGFISKVLALALSLGMIFTYSIPTYAAETENAPTNINEARQNLSEAEELLKQAEEARINASNELTDADAALSEADSIKKDAEKALESAKTTSDNAFAGYVADSEAVSKEADKVLADARKSLEAAKTEAEGANSAYNTAVNELKQAEENYEALASQEESARQTIESKETELASVEDEIIAAAGEENTLSEEYDYYMQLADDTETAYHESVEALEAATEAAELSAREVADLTDELNIIEGKLKEAQNDSKYEELAEDVAIKSAVLKEAQDLLEDASKTVKAAKAALSDAEEAYSKALDIAQSAEELLTNIDTANSVMSEKDDVLSQKEDKKALAQAMVGENTGLAKQAEDALKEADSALEAAKKDAEAAQNALTQIEDAHTAAIEEAKANLEEAKAAYDHAGIDYFNAKMLDGRTYEQMIEDTRNNERLKKRLVFSTKDKIKTFDVAMENLTTPKLLLKSANLANEGNEYRKLEGVRELVLTPEYMLISAISNAASMYDQDHVMGASWQDILWNGKAGNQTVFSSPSGENLSWASYKSPYDGWYTNEKHLMELYPDKLNWYGHYLTLKNSRYIATGVSWDGYNAEQAFFGPAKPEWADTEEGYVGTPMTPDEFIADLEAFVKPYEDAVSEAQEKLDALTGDTEYNTEAKAAKDEADQKVTEAETDKVNAELTLAEANQDLEDAEKNLEAAINDYNEYAEGEYKDARATLEAATKAYTDYCTEHPDIEADVTNAQNNKNKAEEGLDEAEREYASRAMAVDSAEEDYDKAVETLNAESEEIAQLAEDVKTAKRNLEIAIEENNNNSSKLEKAKADEETAKQNKEDAVSDAEKARQLLENKLEELEQLNAKRDDIQEELDTAKAIIKAIDDAEQAVSDKTVKKEDAAKAKQAAESDLNSKNEAVKSAQETADKAKAAYEEAKKINADDENTYSDIPSLKEAKDAATAAEKELAKAHEAYSEAEKTYTSVKEAYDKAAAEYGTAKDNYDKANDDLQVFINADISLNPDIVVTGIKDRSYNGKVQKPSVKVTANGQPVTVKVTYSTSCKAVGTHKVTITGTGEYTGKIVKSFRINPKSTTCKLTGKKKALYVKIASASGAGYYQISYKKKSSSKWKTISTKYKAKTISKLSAKTYYNVKVRSARKVSGKCYYSVWSKTYTVKTK